MNPRNASSETSRPFFTSSAETIRSGVAGAAARGGVVVVRGYSGRGANFGEACPVVVGWAAVGDVGRAPPEPGAAGAAGLGWERGVFAGGSGWRGTFTGVLHEFRA